MYRVRNTKKMRSTCRMKARQGELGGTNAEEVEEGVRQDTMQGDVTPIRSVVQSFTQC